MSVEVFSAYNENELKHIYEPQPGLFIAESPNVIERALDAGYVAEAFLVEERYLREKENDLIKRCPGAEVYLVDEESKKNITGYPMTRGMLAAMRRKNLQEIQDITGSASRIAILENVMNPTNVGAIFRSAAALGIDGMILTSGCSDPLYRRAVRVSMGTVFQIPWTIIDYKNGDWIDEDGIKLKEQGFKLVSMALKHDTYDIDDPHILGEKKLAIILGTEGDGLHEKTIKGSDMTIKIPMSHGVDSLNVSNAAAIAFWELCHI